MNALLIATYFLCMAGALVNALAHNWPAAAYALLAMHQTAALIAMRLRT